MLNSAYAVKCLKRERTRGFALWYTRNIIYVYLITDVVFEGCGQRAVTALILSTSVAGSMTCTSTVLEHCKAGRFGFYI